MAKKQNVSEDKKFHYKIRCKPSEEYLQQNPSIYYVENFNADFDYDLAATDFKLAADQLIAAQKADPYLSNWTAPVCYLIRQTVELKLKALLQMAFCLTDKDAEKITFTHNLEKLWKAGRDWLVENKYNITEDARLMYVDRLVENLHAIDPSGDLFRFGTAKDQVAFGRKKTYDRVGYNQDLLFDEFNLAHDCLSHWTAVLLRKQIQKEEKWTDDPYFDAEDFPKK